MIRKQKNDLEWAESGVRERFFRKRQGLSVMWGLGSSFSECSVTCVGHWGIMVEKIDIVPAIGGLFYRLSTEERKQAPE